MNRIRKKAPGIEISIENGTRDVFKRVEDGSVDLVFFNETVCRQELHRRAPR
jgi:hypothetical protein